MATASEQTERYPWLAKYPDGIDWYADIPTKPLYEILDHAVATYPDNGCVDFLDKAYTYREIGDLTHRAAKGLQAMGVGKGSKVGLFLPNCPYSVIFYFAILKAGGTVVNYNPLYAKPEVRHQIEDSETDVMVTLDLKVLYDKLAPLLDESRLSTVIVGRMQDVLPFPKNVLFPIAKRREVAVIPRDDRHVFFQDLTDNDGAYDPVTIDPAEDIAVLQYTGGTTGVPKGAMLSHGNLYANTMQCHLWFVDGQPGSDIVMGILPIFHVFAMTTVMNYGIYGGAKLVLLPRFEIKQVLKTITKKRPTVMPGVPTMYNAINNYPELGKYDLSSLKHCLSGGAALPVEVKRTFERVTGCVLVEGYGLSETSPVTHGNPFHGENKEGSIGLPMPRTVVTIVDLDDPRKLLPLGETGEICLSGPQVMRSYWNKPEETAEAIVDGRFRTGDIGYLDEDGYTFIVDRKKEMILAGGYNIFPRNVEEVIYTHPAVVETAVIGVPDAYRGQTVKAFVVCAAGQTVSEEDLTAFLKDKLSPIEIPKIYEFRDELPKSAIGKILKKTLLEEEVRKAELAGSP